MSCIAYNGRGSPGRLWHGPSKASAGIFDVSNAGAPTYSGRPAGSARSSLGVAGPEYVLSARETVLVRRAHGTTASAVEVEEDLIAALLDGQDGGAAKLPAATLDQTSSVSWVLVVVGRCRGQCSGLRPRLVQGGMWCGRP